jgi:hypothetical protein
MLIPDARERSRLHREQFNDNADLWNDAVFQQKLNALREEGHAIKNVDDLISVMEREELHAIDEIRQVHGQTSVREVDRPFPMNVWISGESQAVFSVPWFGAGAFEHGFRTTDLHLIRDLREIWSGYAGNHGPSRSAK